MKRESEKRLQKCSSLPTLTATLTTITQQLLWTDWVFKLTIAWQSKRNSADPARLVGPRARGSLPTADSSGKLSALWRLSRGFLPPSAATWSRRGSSEARVAVTVCLSVSVCVCVRLCVSVRAPSVRARATHTQTHTYTRTRLHEPVRSLRRFHGDEARACCWFRAPVHARALRRTAGNRFWPSPTPEPTNVGSCSGYNPGCGSRDRYFAIQFPYIRIY